MDYPYVKLLKNSLTEKVSLPPGKLVMFPKIDT